MRFLDTTIEDNWEPEVKEMWRHNQERVKHQILGQFGPADGQRKIDDFMALDAAPFSVVAQHTQFLHEVRMSFVAGAYYPCLTASGALGERILNQLIFTMRDDFPKSSKVTLPKQFDNWGKALVILHDQWGALDSATEKLFKKLEKLRNKAVHYTPELDGDNVRARALEAIDVLQKIISAVFSPIGPSPWLLNDAPGEFFIALDQETHPIVKHFLIPASVLVSPNYRWSQNEVVEDEKYQLTFPALTDKEFTDHRTNPSIWPSTD